MPEGSASTSTWQTWLFLRHRSHESADALFCRIGSCSIILNPDFNKFFKWQRKGRPNFNVQTFAKKRRKISPIRRAKRRKT
uniref:Uncharacterized protein n=1 Tax=Panagrolaimus sp. JU765 TaxID=591449 RepID=A0AC34R1H0_9BILA